MYSPSPGTTIDTTTLGKLCSRICLSISVSNNLLRASSDMLALTGIVLTRVGVSPPLRCQLSVGMGGSALAGVIKAWLRNTATETTAALVTPVHRAFFCMLGPPPYLVGRQQSWLRRCA